MEFNINRLMRLMKRDVIVYRKPVILGVAAIFIIHMLLLIRYGFDDSFIPEVSLVVRLNFLLIAGGLLLTTVVFWEFKSAAGRVQFLSLPASTSEKLISRWLYTAFLYPIACLLLFALIYLASSPFIDYDFNHQVFEVVGDAFLAYWIAHPIVFMFSIWYHRYVAPKVIVSTLVFAFGLLVVFYVMHRLFFHELYSGFRMVDGVTVDPEPSFQIKVEGMAASVAKILGLVIVPVFFTLVSYFKLKEKQA